MFRKLFARLRDEAPPQRPRVDLIEVDPRVAREVFYGTPGDQPEPCPRCGGELRPSYQTYVIATRRGPQLTDRFITSSDFGWFCRQCPTVVIDKAGVQKLLNIQLPGWDIGSAFTVLGLVDMDAIPADRHNVPLGDPENPIPLIRFTNDRPAAGQPRPQRSGSPQRKKKTKKHRK